MEKFFTYSVYIFIGLGLSISLTIGISDVIAELAGWHNEAAHASMQIYVDQEMNPESLNKPVMETVRCEYADHDNNGRIPCYYETEDGIITIKECYGWRLFPREYIKNVTWSCLNMDYPRK